MNQDWTRLGTWLNGLFGAFIAAFAGITTLQGVDEIGASFGIQKGFDLSTPGGFKKTAFMALGLGITGALQWLKQHPTPFDSTTVSMATTTQPGAEPKTTTTVSETHVEPKP
jgi:hypothetical protein